MVSFLPPGNEFNARELATMTWVVIGFGFALSKPGTATAVARVLLALGARWIAGPLLGMFVWAAAAVLIARRIDLWTPDLVKDSAEWFVLSAMLLYINLTKAYTAAGYFRRAIIDNFKLTAFLVFYTNLFVFPYPVELALVLVTTLLAGCSVVAEYRPEAKAAKRVCDWLLGAIGIFLIAFSTQQLITNWSTVDFGRQGRLLILPIWLTTALVPYLYAWTMFGSYQGTFSRIRFFAPERVFRRKTQVAMILVLNFRVRAVAELRSPWLQRFGSVGTFRQALNLSRAYLDQWRASQPIDAIADDGGHITIVPAIPIPGIREILRRENEAAKADSEQKEA